MKNKQFRKQFNKWLSENGFDDIVAVPYDYFCTWIDEKQIGYTFESDEEQDAIFYKNAKRLGLGYNCSDFVISIFHEIGHIKTDYMISKKMAKKCAKEIKKIENGDIGYKENMKYFNLFNEKLATMWGISYINNHKKEIKKLEKLVKKMGQ